VRLLNNGESSVWPTTVARAATGIAAAEPRHVIATDQGHQSRARDGGLLRSSNDSADPIGRRRSP